MASFSQDYPYAYHVFPLHAAKEICRRKQLLSKKDLLDAGVNLKRRTTGDVDLALGFDDVVHFYLPHVSLSAIESLAILKTQIGIGNGGRPPFPHAVLTIETAALKDDDCMVCNFNIAVSRPAYKEVRGGNHARGMSGQDILRHWQGFRNDDPNQTRMRRSNWVPGKAVPLMTGPLLSANPGDVGYRMERNRKVPELLLDSPYNIPGDTEIHAFSPWDRDSIDRLPNWWKPIALSRHNDWYFDQDRVPKLIREQIHSYFGGGQFPALDYDQRR